MDLSDYVVVDEHSDHVVLINNTTQQTFIYREYEIPKFIGHKQIIPRSMLVDLLEQRKSMHLQQIVCLSDFTITSKVCLLFECYVKNFDEELQRRMNTSLYWSEEELYNTFQACLAALKSLHDCEISHGCISSQSIVFGQDQMVKLADHFTISNNFRRNWTAEPSADEYGYWAPEILNEYEGWKSKFETVENDIWGMGLVFLEAMTLRSSFEYYYLEQDDKLYLDFQSIENSVHQAEQMYSQDLISLVKAMLLIDPIDRTWDAIITVNANIQGRNIIHPIPEETEEDSQILEGNDDISNPPTLKIEGEKNRLLGMLESCLLKSKQLISENENRKSKRPSCEFITKSQQSPGKEQELNSSILRLVKNTKHQKKGSNDILSTSVLMDIPQNKQRIKQQSIILEKSKLINPSPLLGPFNPDDFSNWQQTYVQYNGETLNKKVHGKGQLQFSNGAVLQGSFSDGKVDGYGILIAGGQIVVGYWKNNILVQII